MEFIEILKAILLGIVEGITEWLPVSSTGHMILLNEFISLEVSEEFMELFLVVIQLGAIAAVPMLFWHRLNPFSNKKSAQEKKETWNLWGKVAAGSLPAVAVGLFLDDFLDKHLYNYIVVSVALVFYGIAFILVEKLKKNREYRVNKINELTYRDALVIGGFQVLSLIPGTSRSGSTMLGGMLTGVSRVASAEFSFFMAIPIMIGASLLKIAKFVFAGFTATGMEIALLVTGMLVSFVVSVTAIKFLLNFVKKHNFSPFGVYRIILGVFVISYFLIAN